MSQQQTQYNAPYNAETTRANTGPNSGHDRVVIDMAAKRQRTVATARYILQSNPVSRAYTMQKQQEAAWNATKASAVGSTPTPHTPEMNTQTGDGTSGSGLGPEMYQDNTGGDHVAIGLKEMEESARASLNSLHGEANNAQ